MSDEIKYLYETAFVYWHDADHGKQYEGWTIYLRYYLCYEEKVNLYIHNASSADIGPFKSEQAAQRQLLEYLKRNLNPERNHKVLSTAELEKLKK